MIKIVNVAGSVKNNFKQVNLFTPLRLAFSCIGKEQWTQSMSHLTASPPNISVFVSKSANFFGNL